MKEPFDLPLCLCKHAFDLCSCSSLTTYAYLLSPPFSSGLQSSLHPPSLQHHTAISHHHSSTQPRSPTLSPVPPAPVSHPSQSLQHPSNMPLLSRREVNAILDAKEFGVGPFFRAVQDDIAATSFAVHTGILPYGDHGGPCPEPTCRTPMSLTTRTDGHGFIPKRWHCKRCKKFVAVTKNTWFFNGKISPRQSLEMMVSWLCRRPIQDAARESCVSERTAGDYYRFCREVCAVKTTNDVIAIGGRNLHVEIDESHLCSKKYPGHFWGRPLKSQNIWVFGGVCRETNERFCVVVPDRTRETLFPIIQRRIAPGSIILHDAFATYHNLHEIGYRHLTINHSRNFVDPANSNIHTNKIERLWGDLKAHILSYQGEANLQLYVQEYVYRRMYFDEVANCYLGKNFKIFLQDVRTMFPGPFGEPQTYNDDLV